jgi:hypothetical protein
VFSFTLFATLLTTFFPPPSKYCSSGINDKHRCYRCRPVRPMG